MGKGTDKLYITHSEVRGDLEARLIAQWSGQLGAGHSAAGTGAQSNKSHFARLPFDHCALSLAPFDIPVS